METTYTYDEALEQSLHYFKGNELAAKVFISKYALRNNKGELLEKDPNDMHWRIANELARIESQKFKNPLTAEQIFGYLKDFKRIVPQGSPMFGIGNNNQFISLSNCYVIHPPEDSYGGILRTDEEIVQISKRRGGVGTDLSNLRPTGAPTTNSSRTSSGLVSFSQRYSNSINEVGQNGRRGALMITLSVHHPDIRRFISMKNDNASVRGANISVRLSDEFLQAVMDDTDYQLRWPVEADNPVITQMVPAREIWKEIIHCAWLRAEPGLIFWDNIIRESPADCYAEFGYKTVSTNPCSELPLSILDSCRLLLLVLFNYVVNPFTPEAYFDYEAFTKDAEIAQRFMDDIIDLELEKIQNIISKIESDPELDDIKQRELSIWQNIYDTCYNGRRTGTGITALGDTLAALGIRYGSDESIAVVGKIYRTLKLACYKSSVDMAEELGAFPVWDSSLEKKNPFLLRIKDEDKHLYDKMQKVGRRNISLLTTAPTGSTSMLSMLINHHGTTGGIEPATFIEATRFVKINPDDENTRTDRIDEDGIHWQKYTVYHAGIYEWLKVTGKSAIDETCPYYKATAEDIDWVNRVKLQAEATKHVDHSISSTINLPKNVKEEEVAKIYETAWKYGCKGITVYRAGCREGVILDASKKEEDIKLIKTRAPKRPKELPCNIYKMSVRNKPFIVFVGFYNDEPYEVMACHEQEKTPKKYVGVVKKVKRGHYQALVDNEVFVESITDWCHEDEEAITRLVSASLRHGTPIKHIVEQLEKTKGDMRSFARALARALKKEIRDGEVVAGMNCPSCSLNGNSLIRQEGCIVCTNCGWSGCS